MSNAINAYDLQIPSSHGIIESIPQEDLAVYTALRSAIKFTEGLESLSSQQFLDPIIAGNINTRMTELGGMVGLPTPDITQALATDRGDVVSQEGIGIVFKTMIQNVIKWFMAFVDWIKDLIKKNKVVSKTQEAASSTVKSQMSRAANSQSKDKRDVQATFNVTTRALVIFHTPTHTPKVGYKYNAKNIQTALSSVLKAATLLGSALEDEMDAMVLGVNIVSDNVMLDKPISSTELYKINQHRKLYGLTHNGYKMIGLQLVEKPITSDFSVRSEKTGMVNFARDNGWYNEGKFELTLDSKDLVGYANEADATIGKMNKLSDGLIDRLDRSGIVRRIQDLKKYTDALLKEGSDLEPAQQMMLMKRLLSVQELIMALQLNIQTFDLFVKNYNSMLISVGSSCVRIVTGRGETVE